jgi:hypothetical protein
MFIDNLVLLIAQPVAMLERTIIFQTLIAVFWGFRGLFM